jgi:excisionase family DNA binding protein
MDKLLTTKETAKVLGLSSRTLDVWRCTGKSHVPFVKIGRSVRYRMSDIESYIRNQTMTQTA